MIFTWQSRRPMNPNVSIQTIVVSTLKSFLYNSPSPSPRQKCQKTTFSMFGIAPYFPRKPGREELYKSGGERKTFKDLVFLWFTCYGITQVLLVIRMPLAHRELITYTCFTSTPEHPKHNSSVCFNLNLKSGFTDHHKETRLVRMLTLLFIRQNKLSFTGCIRLQTCDVSKYWVWALISFINHACLASCVSLLIFPSCSLSGGPEAYTKRENRIYSAAPRSKGLVLLTNDTDIFQLGMHHDSCSCSKRISFIVWSIV